MNTTVLVILILANLPLYWFFGKALFKDWQGLLACLKFSLIPSIDSWTEDWWAGMRLYFYIIGCAACVFAEYKIIEKLFLAK